MGIHVTPQQYSQILIKTTIVQQLLDSLEKEMSTKFAVDSICTQRCGQTFSGRSCTKVGPFCVYPTGKKEHSIQMNNGFPQKGTIVKYCDINYMSVRAWLYHFLLLYCICVSVYLIEIILHENTFS